MADVETYNIVDESLLRDTIRDHRLTSLTMLRVVTYIGLAEQAGADGVLVTCSSIGPAVDATKPLVAIPVLRVDEPMAAEAVQVGSRIGVLATLSTTLEPTAALIRRMAESQGVHVELETDVCDGAFGAAAVGDMENHDKLVRVGLRRLAGQSDVIVLAQASMARVVDTMPDGELTMPVLSSPRSGVEAMARLLSAEPGRSTALRVAGVEATTR
jgi:Asp/Glu/hydantoin racemase